ncbi:MAG: NAD kinase [Chitinophagaceae bacterium]|jgi:NAD+ kinase|nr:NAD kinase [Chitinophagaceae bacterium]
MKVAIYSRGQGLHQQDIHTLLHELQKHEATILLFQSIAEEFPEVLLGINKVQLFSAPAHLDAGIDCLISLGGDGTILDAVRFVCDKNIPILGINFGRLGFLASLGRNEISQAVDALINHSYMVDKRTLIRVDANMPLFGDMPFGLNDFVLSKTDTAAMIKIHTYLNGEFLNTYWADGLILATPTGSTAYNMSCNGPVVFPDSSSFVITPIAPHQLNIRPIIVPDNNIISFEVESRFDKFICSLDSRREIVPNNIQLAIRKENFKVNIIRLSENSFLSTLRSKFAWGMDVRN